MRFQILARSYLKNLERLNGSVNGKSWGYILGATQMT